MYIEIQQLMGKTLIDISGRAIGTVERAMVDGESWAIELLRVRLRDEVADELGLASHWYQPARLDVPTGLILGVRDAIVVRAALDELRSLLPDNAAMHEQPPLARWWQALRGGRRLAA